MMSKFAMAPTSFVAELMGMRVGAMGAVMSSSG